jgi:hypothetical protein
VAVWTAAAIWTVALLESFAERSVWILSEAVFSREEVAEVEIDWH